MSSRPIVWKTDRVKASPFAKGKSATAAMKMAKEKEREYKAGENIGFSYISSLKSMGRIPRSDGTYKLGEKYKKL